MKLLLIDVYNNKVETVEANGLEDYYKYLDCDTIDIIQRWIGDIPVNIICDDEGTFKEHPKISAIDVWGDIALVGNLLIAGGEVVDGELTELTEGEIEVIKKWHLAEVTTKQYKEPYQIITEFHF